MQSHQCLHCWNVLYSIVILTSQVFGQTGLDTKDPALQSIVSLTKSLINDLLSLLVRLKSSVLIFFAEKM